MPRAPRAVLAAIAIAASAPTRAAPPTVATPEDALERGATLVERRAADLDGDGVQEVILVSGLRPSDAARPPGVFEGTIVVRVLQRSGEAWREAGRFELHGVPERAVVADVGEGAERTRLLLTAAASGAATQLRAHALRDGALVPFLPEGTTLARGWASVVPERFVETWTRADEPGTVLECCPSAYEVTRLVPREGRLTPVETARVLAEEADRAGVARPSRAGRLCVVAKEPPETIVPAEVLADRDWLVRAGRSIGTVELGMTRAQVHALLGPPRTSAAKGRGVAERWGGRSRIVALFAGDEVAQLAVDAPWFHTWRGLRTGDPVERVGTEFRPPARVAAGRLLETGAGLSFALSRDGRTIAGFIVHRPGTAPEPVELGGEPGARGRR